jgi:hypothetical protein
VLEFNGLGEFGCKVEPVYSGRKVTAVQLSWRAKNLDERKFALNELRFSRIGRRARLKGEVVQIEREFREWVADRDSPSDYAAADSGGGCPHSLVGLEAAGESEIAVTMLYARA